MSTVSPVSCVHVNAFPSILLCTFPACNQVDTVFRFVGKIVPNSVGSSSVVTLEGVPFLHPRAQLASPPSGAVLVPVGTSRPGIKVNEVPMWETAQP